METSLFVDSSTVINVYSTNATSSFAPLAPLSSLLLLSSLSSLSLSPPPHLPLTSPSPPPHLPLTSRQFKIRFRGGLCDKRLQREQHSKHQLLLFSEVLGRLLAVPLFIVDGSAMFVEYVDVEYHSDSVSPAQVHE